MVKSFISIYVSPAGTLRFPYGNLKNIFAYFYLDWRVFKSLERGKKQHLA